MIISTGRSSSIFFSSSSVGDAVHARHHHVDDRGIERQRARELEPFGGVGREAHLVALPRQERLEDLAHDLLVVDDEDRALASGRDALGLGRCSPAHVQACLFAARDASAARADASGSVRVNRVPCPRLLSQVIVPPCSCTMP